MAYNPAGNLTTSPGFTHFPAAFYSRRALDQVLKNFVFMSVTDPDVLPLREGKTIQWYRYGVFGANTTPASEGTIGSSLSLSTSTVTATVSEYSDFITLSRHVVDTAIDPMVDNAASNIGYRAGLTLDTLVRTELESVTATDIETIGTYGSITDLLRAGTILHANDVRTRQGDEFVGIIHPYALYDIMADNTAGGFVDVSKYANPNTFMQGLNGEVGKVEGVRLLKSTNVGTSGTAPEVKYATYVVGRGAIGAVNLQSRGPSNVTDPTQQRFSVNVVQGGPQIADPAGMIGAAVSYYFVFVAQLLDTTTYRYRTILMDASLV